MGSGLEEQGPLKGVEGMARIVLRPLASTLPPVFFAFGTGSLKLSGLQLGMIPISETRRAALVRAALLFPPLAPSPVLAFLSRETLGATLMADAKPGSANNLRTASPVDCGRCRRGEGRA